ncbi:DNA polymerase IV [Glaciecola siphonariae]|uniref:DNA polymerase IV n=1 Tax=Glaciecola siphonariae TaxID=521012 RepID=A0ABV9M189_9ALTE
MRKIIHVDMDAFYVSVEIRDKPELAGFPVAVGGKTANRGVLTTCNYIAREFGVRSAMPAALALRKCPKLIIVPGRMQVYQQVSQHIREIFSRYTELIEPLSLDEAFLDVTHCELFKGSATLIAQDIRRTIEQELNLTASAGVAPIKFVAKVASDLNKPNGQYVVTPDELDAFIEALPLNKIPGVGKVTFEKLQQLGLLTGADIKALPESELVDKFGKFGRSLWQKCQGNDPRAVETSRIRKSVGVERTFNTNQVSEDELASYLLDKLLPELTRRAEKYLTSRGIDKIGVKVKFHDFQQTTKEIKHHTIDANVLLDLLHEALKRGVGKQVRLLGLQVGLRPPAQEQAQMAFDWE